MSTPYRRGARVEYAVIGHLKRMGYEGQRTAGSHSPFDVVGWDDCTVKLIQVKRVSEPADVVRALREARAAWEDRNMPHIRGVLIEAWIRCQREWHVFRLD